MVGGVPSHLTPNFQALKVHLIYSCQASGKMFPILMLDPHKLYLE